MWNTVAPWIVFHMAEITDVEYSGPWIVFHIAKNYQCGIHLPRIGFSRNAWKALFETDAFFSARFTKNCTQKCTFIFRGENISDL